MKLEVVVTTTKPDLGSAEYGLRNTETGEWVRHGVQIPVDISALTKAQQAVISGARTIMQGAATAHAVSQGFIDPA